MKLIWVRMPVPGPQRVASHQTTSSAPSSSTAPHANQTGPSSQGRWAQTFFNEAGVTVRRVLTDNGSCYRSRTWANPLATAGIAHKRTLLDEWPTPSPTSANRIAATRSPNGCTSTTTTAVTLL